MDVIQYIETLKKIRAKVQGRIEWIELNRSNLDLRDYITNVVNCETDLVKIDLRILELETQQSALKAVMDEMQKKLDEQ